MPELQERVFGLITTTHALVENQSEIANRVDNIFEEIDKVDKRVFAVAYAEGEKVLKSLKKTTVWNSLPREEKTNQFLEYLKELGIRTTPSVEVIICLLYTSPSPRD